MDVDQVIRLGGGVTVLAGALAVDHSAVSKWKRSGCVPAKHVGRVSALTGIPPHRIRPDLFPAPQPEGAA